MNKTLIIIAVIITAVSGVLAYQYLTVPQSVQIRAEISRVLDGTGDAISKVLKIDLLNDKLASALVDEGKHIEAAYIYEQKIEKLRRDERRTHESLNLEAAYFDLIESCYRAAKDTERADKAKKKAAKALSAAKRIPAVAQRSVLD